jgi:hypothetical protein
MSAQVIFDKVVAHLRQQGRKALRAEGGCAYRTPEGLKCAVGCLISDEEYSQEMEGHTIDWLNATGMLPSHLTSHYNLLMALQWVHDCHDAAHWELGLQQVAKNHKLTYKTP